MSDPSKVYCDNEELLLKILSEYPTPDGLFSHEISMLIKIDYMTATTKIKDWAKEWYGIENVRSTGDLLKSLIERGFVKECSNEELFYCVKMKDIQAALKMKGIKPGNKKDQALDLLIQAYTADQLYEALGFHYYILTDAGRKAVKYYWEYHPEQQSAYSEESPKSEKLRPDQIQMHIVPRYSPIGYELYIRSSKSVGQEKDDQPLSYTIESLVDERTGYKNRHLWEEGVLNGPLHLKVYIDEVPIYESNDVVYYRLLSLSNLLLVGLGKDFDNIHCLALDLSSHKVVAEKITDHKSLTGYNIPDEIIVDNNDFIWKDVNLRDPDSVPFFFCVRNKFADDVVQKVISKYADVSRMPSLMPDDYALNYMVQIRDLREEIEALILFMFEKEWVVEPCVINLPIRYILQTMRFHSDDMIFQAILTEDYWSGTGMKVIQAVRDNISSDFTEVAKKVSEHYPLDIIWDGCDGELFAKKKEKFDEIVPDKKQFEVEIVRRLKEEGMDNTDWSNKIDLFLLAYSLYQDAQFQYQLNWLEGVSIDVYIPQIKTGIEFQSAECFKSDESLDKVGGLKTNLQQIRMKRNCCKQRGVRLVVWPCDLKITEKNMDSLLKKRKRG